MVQQPVEDGGREHLIAEDLTPVQKALVGGQDQRRLLIASGQQPKEQVRLLPCERQVADLVNFG